MRRQTASELIADIDRGAAPRILDVRSPQEYARGHVPGALNIPFQLVSSRAADIPGSREDPIVVYCGHGPRAYIAAAALRYAEFSDIRLLKGHMAKWKKAGLRQDVGAGSSRPGRAGARPYE